MDCILTCPDCGKGREVTPRYACEFKGGRCSGRCVSCANKAKPTNKSRAAEPGRKVCRHCNYSAVNRSRGLCWRCYYSPGVLDLYPSTSKYARRGFANFTGAAKPCRPTNALPGTPEKRRVLERRARLGLEMHHPKDARRPLEDAPAAEVVLPVDPCEYDEEAA